MLYFKKFKQIKQIFYTTINELSDPENIVILNVMICDISLSYRRVCMCNFGMVSKFTKYLPNVFNHHHICLQFQFKLCQTK